MIKVLSIFGTRPEAIKMAPVIKALEAQPDRIASQVCVTGQHRQMLDQVLTLFDLHPDFDLNVMQVAQTPSLVAANVLTYLDPILRAERPDWVLVQGDTTTVMAAAIAAYHCQIKVGHVEAGLRTRDKWHPFPEEINRRVAGVIADLHFAPTAWARDNLLSEGIPAEAILVTGNPVIDALQWMVQQPFSGPLPVWPSGKHLVLVTAHRRENFGEPLEQICLALRQLAEKYREEVHLLYPVHLNPNVQEAAYRLLGDIPNITLTAPLDYQTLIHVLRQAYLVLTDSGGIQEEAPGFGVPVLVLREITERPEAVQAGIVKLVGRERATIVENVSLLLDDPAAYARMACAYNPYGDGKAAGRIAQALLGEPVIPWSVLAQSDLD